MTLAEALVYQREQDEAKRPFYGNPNLAAQGRRYNLAERQQTSPLMQAGNVQFEKEKSSLSDRGAVTDLINKGFIAGLGGAPVDLINMGLTPLGMGSAFPFGGSEHIKRVMEDYGVATPTERPIMEGIASLTPPRAVMGVARVAGQGAEAVARAAGPELARGLENYMSKTGMQLNAAPNATTILQPGGLGAFPSTTVGRIRNATNERGGYSVNLLTGDQPTSGLMMGRYANSDPRNTSGPVINANLINEHALKNAVPLSSPENYFGTWLDPQEKLKAYLDVSKRFNPDQIRQATKYGERTGQLAGYNVGSGQTFPVGNWEEFIRSPEFMGPSGRLAQMEQVGRNYLAKHPTGDWWDIRGSTMENVYGKSNLPQVAGFTASTAPVSAPRENIQTMSEYMRRHIRGEPILQPNWRVPAGAMTRTEGVQIGMEGSRANNLTQSSLGNYDNLSGMKVGEEGRALMGDPNAVVLDRHQIRVSEDPSRGIFASGQPDIIDPKRYGLLKGSITDYAKDYSTKNANRASADIWTGIRETIKNNSDLFGTKFKGSAITGDSKSYIDHFNDLIKDKAKFMGISVQEMKSKLGSGDANLLSLLLSTPIGAAIYAEYQNGLESD